MQVVQQWSGHPSVTAVRPRLCQPSYQESHSWDPATCEGLLILIEAWTSDYTNMYKIG